MTSISPFSLTAIALSISAVAANPYAVAQEDVTPATDAPAATPSAKAEWLQDWAKAQKIAAETKRPMLVDFTGSDWCRWCIRLDEEVFSKQEFQDYAAKAFVLVKLDYPNDKSILPEGVEAQNDKLMETYQVQGFPTIMLMDAKGMPFAQTGYAKGGPTPYVESLKKLSKKMAERDGHMAAAKQAEGAEKAGHLVKALDVVGDEIAAKHYLKQVKEVLALDPQDTLKAKARLTRVLQQPQVDAAITEFSILLTPFFETGDMDGAKVALEKFEAERKPTGLKLQCLMYVKAVIALQSGQLADGRKMLQEGMALDAESAMGVRMKQELDGLPPLPGDTDDGDVEEVVEEEKGGDAGKDESGKK